MTYCNRYFRFKSLVEMSTITASPMCNIKKEKVWLSQPTEIKLNLNSKY